MKDPEFIALRNKFLFAILIALVFVVPLAVFVIKTYDTSESDVLSMIKNNESFALLIVESQCSKCERVNDIIEKNNIGHFVLNKSKDKHYEEIMIRLDLSDKELAFPVIAYIENGEMKSYLVEVVEEKEIMDFFSSYNLIK